MINPNYVPEWYTSPFQHIKYTLVRNQVQLDILFDDVADTDKFMSCGCDAQVNFYNDDSMAIVQIGEVPERTPIEIYGLLLHEGVHVWQRIKQRMNELNPSIEFEAYSIQAIAQDLFAMYEESECDQKQNSI
ncbi:hypothetical protein [Acinetobacter sp. WCHAc060007]|uniref:hypothetical protein n=1 Tax=Acinetobacter sp. WCHAc060007 TaxID=2419605 RepID=UPI000EA06D81|nr:hypothetical protein [Acinetobacter sp. WCHAc060007]RKG37884.1 hypothetical protein D7V31_16040 [Acinetobacter sp. WCHAc060007]